MSVFYLDKKVGDWEVELAAHHGQYHINMRHADNRIEFGKVFGIDEVRDLHYALNEVIRRVEIDQK